MSVFKYPVIKADFEEYSKAPEAKGKVFEPANKPKVGDTLITYELDERINSEGKKERFYTGREKRFVITNVEPSNNKVSTIIFKPEESK